MRYFHWLYVQFRFIDIVFFLCFASLDFDIILVMLSLSYELFFLFHVQRIFEFCNVDSIVGCLFIFTLHCKVFGTGLEIIMVVIIMEFSQFFVLKGSGFLTFLILRLSFYVLDILVTVYLFFESIIRDQSIDSQWRLS